MKALWFVMLFFFAISGFAQEKIACIGNSITYGAGISDRTNDSYPAHLQKLLGENFSVVNCGNSGRTMLKNGDYPLWVEPEFKTAVEMVPDIVVILLGTNDSKPWNWEPYRDEFIPDYIAMIDTFRTINPDVKIYACLPPPAFSVQWGIRDSVITTDTIPMVNKIADSTSVETIDFYTPFIESNALFPDDIHPNAEGAWEMAKIVYNAITGKTVSQIQDIDLARGKMVTIDSINECESADALVDGDHSTLWSCTGNGSAIVDLGAVESIDMFQTDFGQETEMLGQFYKIDVSTDSETWITVVDKSVNGDSSVHIAVDKIDPVDARFVKLTPLGPVNGAFVAVGAFDFKVLKTAPIHAPAFFINEISARSKFTRFYYHFVSSSAEHYQKVLRAKNDEPFADLNGYRLPEDRKLSGTVRPDEVLKYVTKAYYDGVEVVSADTLTVDWSISSVEMNSPAAIPTHFVLEQNFPNPFNPSTQIRYYLSQPANTEIEIFNTLGESVHILSQESKNSGWHNVQWDGRDLNGKVAASGIYFYQLRVDNNVVETKNMLMLR